MIALVLAREHAVDRRGRRSRCFGLAGLRSIRKTNGPHRRLGGTGMTLRDVATGAERKLAVPADARIGGVSFSPDGKRFGFTNTTRQRASIC